MNLLVISGMIVFSLAFVGTIVSRRDMAKRFKLGETLASPGTRKSFIAFAVCVVVQFAAFAFVWFAK